MEDDVLQFEQEERTLFVIAEVKSDACAINGTWRRPELENIQVAVRRLGFASTEAEVSLISEMIYERRRWENSEHVLQYVVVGSKAGRELGLEYQELVQVTWARIAEFLFRRFRNHQQKLGKNGRVHAQWPEFGKEYGRWFAVGAWRGQPIEAPIDNYIRTGSCLLGCGNTVRS